MVNRYLFQIVKNKLFSGKLILITGARQTGKSTLLKHIQNVVKEKSLFLDCDDPNTRAMLQNQSTANLLRLVGDNKLVFIDEAQRVNNIGLSLKQIFDNNPNCQLLVSGSSAFELNSQINEPLTGRKWGYNIFTLSYEELKDHTTWIEEFGSLENRLLYGAYPDVINSPGNEQEVLFNLSGSYLYKDILSYNEVRKPQLLEKLLQFLAFQVASEVKYNELAKALQVNSRTIENYIDLLEKSFVIFRLASYSRNVRNEIKKSRKIYFYDNGIRNSLISNFNAINLRQDVGQLWENYLVAERVKRNAYHKNYCNSYFWRTTQQQEVDYIEEREGKLFAYEFKWGEKKTPKLPKTFQLAYPKHEFKLINRQNYDEFLT
jgi:predicted AAA+ superfamily ATPase